MNLHTDKVKRIEYEKLVVMEEGKILRNNQNLPHQRAFEYRTGAWLSHHSRGFEVVQPCCTLDISVFS